MNYIFMVCNHDEFLEEFGTYSGACAYVDRLVKNKIYHPSDLQIRPRINND